MNRSIFKICKNFNFDLFWIHFVFSLLVYFLGFFSGGFVNCDDLIKMVHKGVVIRYSHTLSSFRLYGSLEFLQQYVTNTSDFHFKFHLYKYLQLDGRCFPFNHVYNHYHLNLYLDNIYNVHYNFSLTHKPLNLGLSPHEFKVFNKEDLKGEKRIQYILNDLKIYDLKILKIQNDTNKFKDFILKNHEKCTFQFKNIFD